MSVCEGKVHRAEPRMMMMMYNAVILDVVSPI